MNISTKALLTTGAALAMASGLFVGVPAASADPPRPAATPSPGPKGVPQKANYRPNMPMGTSCQSPGNGHVCIYVGPVGTQSYVRVWYTKVAGNPIFASLEWRNPAGKYFVTQAVWMAAGETWEYTWHTYIGPGCNEGFLLDHGNLSSYPSGQECV
ncbi:hypothetical protein GCM10010411_74100 [Actinomadura fulvescens]|uniref:Secreted protein n=1 Tax=Actinomadura fulvescens TaxID=46160 RepID=A0ABP6CWN4_9ACTN